MAEPRLLWLTLLVALGALVVSFRPGVPELQIRISGLALQWLGIGTVAIGLRETRKLFERPSLIALLCAWLSRFPRWRRDVRVIAGSGSLGLTGMAARMEVRTPIDPNAPTAAQLAGLTHNVERLRAFPFCQVVCSPTELEAALRTRLAQLSLAWNTSSS